MTFCFGRLAGTPDRGKVAEVRQTGRRKMAGRYRVTAAGAVYFYVEGLAEAQSEALDWARELTQASGTPATARVHRMGSREADELGRDVTPAFWLGSAVGRLEGSIARVAWVPAPKRGRTAGARA
jgi:hypothetical protein